MKTIFRIFSYLKKYKILSIAQLSCSIVMTVLILVFPEITKKITGDIIPNRKIGELIPLIIISASSFFLINLLNSLRIILNNTFEQKVIFDIRSDLYEKIQSLPITWFQNTKTGDVMTRVTEDVTSVERVLIDGVEQGVIATLQMTIVGIYLFTQDAKLALVATIPIPFLLIGAIIYAKTSPARNRKVRKATSSMNALLHDNIAGIQQIKIFSREKKEHSRFNKYSNNLRKATLNLMRVWALYNPGMELIRNLGYILVLGFGAWSIIQLPQDKDIHEQIGVFIAFLIALNLFYEPITKLNMLNQLIQSGKASAERIFHIIDTDNEKRVNYGKELTPPIKGNIKFENIFFYYNKDKLKSPALKNISLDIKSGQTIALVGHTGAGKSTIINLLSGFYESNEGSIYIDGQKISKINKSSLRQYIGYVTQESFLFNYTIKENLLIAKEDATDEEIDKAISISYSKSFIEQLPLGIDTVIGERGVKLSVGERQRLSIARTILKNPPILLLDEATSSVDTQTEKDMQEAFEKLMIGRSSIVIAHRLSTVRNADKIYVLDKGEIIEEGTHETLINKKGKYANLYKYTLR